jgi:hypothetical protein
MAKRKKSRKSSSGNVRQRREERQQAAARRKRNQNLLIGGVATALVAIVGLVIYLNVQAQSPVSGEETFPTQGNAHIEYGSRSPMAYNSVPPTSGPHYGNLVAWNIYDEPIRYEQLVHNMEDGGVIVYYQCEEACPELVEQLTETVEPFLNAGRHVVMVPNDPTWSVDGNQALHADMGAPIVLTAWQRMLKLDEYEHDRIRAFIERYEGIDHHRPAL